MLNLSPDTHSRLSSTQVPLMWLHLQKRPPSLSPSLNLHEVADRLQLIRIFHSNMKDRLEKLLMRIDDINQWDLLFPPAVSVQ